MGGYHILFIPLSMKNHAGSTVFSVTKFCGEILGIMTPAQSDWEHNLEVTCPPSSSRRAVRAGGVVRDDRGDGPDPAGDGALLKVRSSGRVAIEDRATQALDSWVEKGVGQSNPSRDSRL
jgi:hypothetical protein